MDLNEIWQEHKRFIVTVAAGLLVFFIANSVVYSLYNADIADTKRKLGSSQRELKERLYTKSDRAQAEEENDLLTRSYTEMVQAVAFQPRPGFVIDGSSPAKNVYDNAVEAVLGRMDDLANRQRAMVQDGLGLDPVLTANVDEVERHLHALDLLERASTIALEAGVRRIQRIDVRLDPAFTSRRGLGAVERTRIQMETISTAEAVTSWMAMAESPLEPGEEPGFAQLIRRQPLPIQEVEMTRVSSKDDEVRTNITFLVVRVHDLEGLDGEVD